MNIRLATSGDLSEIIKLFESTVRTVNAKDYTPEQIEVWASAKNEKIWRKKVETQHFYIAEINKTLVGFSSIDNKGYLDFMYVRKDHQGKGVAKGLLEAVESKAGDLGIQCVFSSMSITAQPFFLTRGYEETSKETKELDGVVFINCIMMKNMQEYGSK